MEESDLLETAPTDKLGLHQRLFEPEMHRGGTQIIGHLGDPQSEVAVRDLPAEEEFLAFDQTCAMLDQQPSVAI